MPMRKYILLFVCFLITSLRAADHVSFLFRCYDIENGVSSNFISSLLQDEKGFIWIGTDKGIDRYDGTRFTSFNRKNSHFHGLENCDVSSLYQPSANCLWVGTTSGLYIYEYATGKFCAFREKTGEGVEISSLVSMVTRDRSNLFWISTRGQGVFSYDPATRELVQYEMLQSNGYISAVLADQQNNIWLAGMSGTYLLDKEGKRFEEFCPIGQTIYSLTFFEDARGNVWIGTWDRGLMKIGKGRDCTFYLDPQEEGGGVRHVHSILEYTPSTLMVGSDNGLTLLDIPTGSYRLFNDQGGEGESLSDNYVYPLLKDREGGIWLGTFYGGVNYAPPYGGQFERYARSGSSGGFLPGKVASCFQENAAGDVWVGFEDGGVECFSPETGRPVSVPGKEKVCTWNVEALALDGDMLWIATYARGVDVWNVRTGQVTYKGKGMTERDIFSLLIDQTGTVWAGSMKAVYRYDASSDSMVSVNRMGELVRDLKEDAQGQIWAATNGKGVFCYHPGQDVWKHYGVKEGLLGETVLNICVGKNGNIWLGTSVGLYLYEPDTDRFRTVPLDLSSEDICCIIEDGNTLWLTTGKGLVKYIPGSGKKQVFTRADGLQAEAFAISSGLRTRKGKIFVGTTNGFNAFYPYLLHHNDRWPEVVFTGLEIFNKEVPVSPEDGILASPMDEAKEINLSFEDNMVSFLYAALSYCTPSKNQYAYKLEGFDKEWNYVGSQSKATYTNLPAGNYVFRVRASNNDDVWNDEGMSVNVTVHPPFYWTIPFRMAYLLLACSVVGLLAGYSQHRNRCKYEREIELVKMGKDKEMQEAKINFFTMIAHEIRTPVSLIIAPLEKVMQETLSTTVRDNLNVVNRNGQRLLYLVNQLLDFRKVQEKEMKMRFSPQYMSGLLSAVCGRFRLAMEQNGIVFHVELPDDDFSADVDREAVIKLVSNLLSNAIKYTKNEVTLCCTVVDDRTFSIRVSDNGAGIDEEKQKKIFNPFYQCADNKPGTGIGLSIVKGIADAHSGLVGVSSGLDMGASFTVLLPIRQVTAVVQEKKSDRFSTETEGEIPAVSVSPAGGKPVMLLVDDNEEMLQFLSIHFASAYTLMTATDGQQALEVLQKQEVSLIISDWMMPGMDGVELCKQVRKNQLTSHIPFVLLTAKTDLNSKIEGMDGGADVYVEKPFSLQYMEVCIRNLIEQRQLLKNKFSQMPMVPLGSIAGNPADEKFLARMNDLIERNFSNPDLSVDFLAEKLGISRSGLFAKVKALASITPNELIKVVRLKKAASLLAEKCYRINEVCYMVGFDNPSYFSECFQKQFGVKPSKFAGGELS